MTLFVGYRFAGLLQAAIRNSLSSTMSEQQKQHYMTLIRVLSQAQKSRLKLAILEGQFLGNLCCILLPLFVRD